MNRWSIFIICISHCLFSEMELNTPLFHEGDTPLESISEDGHLYWGYDLEETRSTEIPHYSFSMQRLKSFSGSLLRNWSVGMGYFREEMDSELSRQKSLDMRLALTFVRKSWTLAPQTHLFHEVGIAEAEFGYLDRNYIFKNGPDLWWSTGISHRMTFRHQIHLIGEYQYINVSFSGKDFENRVDPRQGQPSSSEMKYQSHRIQLEATRNDTVRPDLDIHWGVFGNLHQTSVDMEIGWTLAGPEEMEEKEKLSYGPVFQLVYQRNVKQIYQLDFRYLINDGIAFSMKLDLP